MTFFMFPLCFGLILEDHKVSVRPVVKRVRPVYVFVCGAFLNICEDGLNVVASHPLSSICAAFFRESSCQCILPAVMVFPLELT
jgi:hypothetical protein